MDLAERVSTLRRANGLSARQLAAMVGVASTTINRIESGAVSPSFEVAQTLLTVLGEPLASIEASDPAAIAAARLAIDPDLDVLRPFGIARWLDRWGAIGLVDDDGKVAPGREPDLLFRAATVARLYRRAGGVDCRPAATWRTLADLFRREEIGYALTGDAAANWYSPSAIESWPVFYVDDVDMAIDVGELDPLPAGTPGARVTLLPFDDICEVGRQDLDGVIVAALPQVAFDCYGGIGRMPEQADALYGRE
ncbi:helix-turn-helix transcriptional regulator [Promicromonospora soli]